MNLHKLEEDIRNFVSADYPNIGVRVETRADDPRRIALYFLERTSR